MYQYTRVWGLEVNTVRSVLQTKGLKILALFIAVTGRNRGRERNLAKERGTEIRKTYVPTL